MRVRGNGGECGVGSQFAVYISETGNPLPIIRVVLYHPNSIISYTVVLELHFISTAVTTTQMLCSSVFGEFYGLCFTFFS